MGRGPLQRHSRTHRRSRDIILDPKNLTPALREPLAWLNGAVPSAPEWFAGALELAPVRDMLETPRGRIEMLSWGDQGKPGLLFVHGNSAHADWWSFIAPFFAPHYRVAAMSLAGMGRSDWRERYVVEDFFLDAQAVVEAAGLDNGVRKPVYIGHSFGGRQVLNAASRHPDRMSAAIVIDTAAGRPDSKQSRVTKVEGSRFASEARPHKPYPSLAAALAHFRLMPPQPVENLFLLDHIARHSLKCDAGVGGGGESWTWCFDPSVMRKRTGSDTGESREVSDKLPFAHIVGENSPVPNRDLWGNLQPIAQHEIHFEIANADHHVMVDQPIALVSAIRALLAIWRI